MSSHVSRRPRSLLARCAGALLAVVACSVPMLHAAEVPATVPSPSVTLTAAGPNPARDLTPLVTLGRGDSVALVVYGKPDLSVTVEVGDDGSIQLPLIGAVRVAGLSPSEAATEVAKAYQAGEFLVNPQVTVTLSKATSQQVAVLGDVGTPGRYPVESRTTVFDLLASAGGKTADGAEVIVLVRTEADGTVSRTPIDLGALADTRKEFPTIKFRGGDTLYVPRAAQIFIYGEVANPGKFALQPGTTLIQALTIAGGVTRRGSMSRIEIKRRTADGTFKTLSPKLNDPLEAEDVIRVKESIF